MPVGLIPLVRWAFRPGFPKEVPGLGTQTTEAACSLDGLGVPRGLLTALALMELGNRCEHVPASTLDRATGTAFCHVGNLQASARASNYSVFRVPLTKPTDRHNDGLFAVGLLNPSVPARRKQPYERWWQ